MNQNMNRSMARSRKKKPQLDKTTTILLVAFAVVALLLAIVGGKFVYDLVKGWSLTSLPGVVVDAPTTGSNSTQTAPTDPLQTNNGPTAKAWDGKSRVNILLLGLDYTKERDITEPGPRMSDTMILVTIDPLTKSIGALSIRRDLWVNVPGHDYNKINKAYWWGEYDNIPGVGGPGLAIQTVEEFLGVPINFYARVDFNTFVKLIDEIQGVQIDVKERMLIDPGNTGNPFWLEPGYQVLPGSYALGYARYRYSGAGDVDRGGRQMEVIQAIRNRIVNDNMMPQLILRAPSLYNELSAGVQTNMTLNQAVQLGLLMIQIPKENFRTFNITYDYCSPERVMTAEGPADILRPFMDKIRTLRDEMFVNGSTAAAPIVPGSNGAPVGGDPLALAKAENARVVIVNGTYVSGLADKTVSYLQSQGLTNVSAGSENGSYTYTTIVIHNATPYTLNYLTGVMKILNNTLILNRFDPNGPADITVYLGSDWANSNPMP
jgi:LCP family protein required for cell wall assembly